MSSTLTASAERQLERRTGHKLAVLRHVENARDDVLAFTTFPKDVWSQIWSNNPAERLNREIRRRTDSEEVNAEPLALTA